MVILDVNIFNKILASLIWQWINIITDSDQLEFIPGMQVWFNVQISTNAIHYTNRLKENTWSTNEEIDLMT